MNILHVNLAMGYTEGMNYQENCVSRFHAQEGHTVSILTTQYCFTEGVWGPCQTSFDYINPDGVHIIRLPFKYKLPYKVNKNIGYFAGTMEWLEKLQPDVICVHNFQFQDLRTIADYVKDHPSVRMYIDNHADFSNSARNWFTRNTLYRFWWKPCAQYAAPQTEKFFGVMPSRVDFMVNIYGIDRKRCELLYMGADDSDVDWALDLERRKAFREKYHITEDEFLIMTGGKIDSFKTQTMLLMQAVQNIDHPKIRMILFGSIDQAYQEQVDQLCDGTKIQYIGWAKDRQSYEFFAAADLVVFPGRHSVYWEQVVALGVPMVCKYWEGTTHVDIGGNVRFLYHDSVEEIQTILEELLQNPSLYQSMKKEAMGEGRNDFLYSVISRKAIGERIYDTTTV